MKFQLPDPITDIEIPCRDCGSPSAVIVYSKRGTFTRRSELVQALCVQHLIKSTDSTDGLVVVARLGKNFRSRAKPRKKQPVEVNDVYC